MSRIAIASNAIEMRSPVVSSMSISRAAGVGEVDELVGGVAHRRDGHDDVVARLAGLDDPLRDPLDALGIGDARTAVLLDDQGHGIALQGKGGTKVILSSRACRPAQMTEHHA